MIDISVIIVSYNTAKIISSCIDSVLTQKGVNFEIIVVDNASPDDSLNVLRGYGEQINVIANPENSGFGKANNLGFKQATGRYLFLLNPDATLQNDNDLAQLVAFMENHPQCGLAGPRVIKNQQQTCPQIFYPGQKLLKKDFSTLPGKIAWVIGACMIIRREAFASAHGFDEDYFLYAEETDLCLRVRQKGYEIGYIDSVTINHIGGASEKTAPTPSVWRRKQNGIHVFYRKHYSSEEAKKIVRKNLKRANLRLMLLKTKKLFGNLNLEQDAKLQRYEVVVETSKEYLKGL